MTKQNAEIIDFVRKTTEAITIMAEGNRAISENTGALKELINAQTTTNVEAFKVLDGKMSELKTLFVYVIIPLIGGILSLVGIKYLFQLP